MKNTICIILMLLGFCSTHAQQTDPRVGFTYQALAIDRSQSQGFGRDTNGKVLANQDVKLRFNIREGKDGEIKYSEIHETSTDAFGIFRLVIGRGEAESDVLLEELQWGQTAYFIEIEIDLGDGFQALGAEELHGAPFALNTLPQKLRLDNNELSITQGNMIQLEDNDSSNELLEDVSLNGSILELTDAAGTKAIDLSSIAGADSSPTNEIQDLALSGNILTITNNTSATPIDLSSIGAGAFSTTDNVTSNEPGDYASDDFVFGSPQLDDDGNPDHSARMLFDKSKGAFRVGGVSGTTWDEANRGVSSIGMGEEALASNENSIAMGSHSHATGSNSIAIGSASFSNGAWSLALGAGASSLGANTVAIGNGTATGNSSVSLGFFTNAVGDISFAVGKETRALSHGETAMGLYNTNYTPNSANLYDPGDRLLVIGNGTDDATRSDAFIMLKNGNTTLNGQLTIDGDNVAGAGEPYTFPAQDGTNGQVMSTDGNGTVSWANAGGAGAFSTTDNITSNAPGDYAADDFVFGSPQLDDDGNPDHNARMFFDKSKRAFRVGYVNSDHWDDINLGSGSIVLGTNSKATGIQSVTLGSNNLASGSTSVAIGNGAVASETSSTAIGLGTTASGERSFATGFNTLASGNSSTAMGGGSQAIGDNSFAIGHESIANTSNSLAMGYQTIANGYSSSAIGFKSSAIGSHSIARGYFSEASGNFSIAMGLSNMAKSYAETVLGSNGTDYNPTSIDSFNSSDRLFVIGNGVDNANRSDAFIMLKNGNTTLNGQLTIDGDNVAGAGEPYTFPAQDGTNGQVMSTDGNGIVSWANAGGAGAFSTTDNITSNAPGDYAADDFVFGSPQLNDDGVANHDIRMFFDKNNGSFRAGFVDNVQWNDGFRGAQSVAMGYNTKALGQMSVAFGRETEATGAYSVAFGFQNSAASSGAFAIGALTNATGSYSMAMGEQTTASNSLAFAMGLRSTASGRASVATGQNSTASGDYSMATGTQSFAEGDHSFASGLRSHSSGVAAFASGVDTEASGDYSTALGSGTTASGNYSISVGIGTTASANQSMAVGFGSTSSGGVSFSAGISTFARSMAETTIGINNTDYAPVAPTTFDASDRLFVIGNGTDNANRSDALIIYKNGNATLAGTLTETSDRRLKKNVVALDESISKLQGLKGVNFKWNSIKPHDTTSIQTGFIAQEVEKLFPELVEEDSEGYKSVNYIGLIPHLVEALKELKSENEELKAELEQNNRAQSSKLNELETRLRMLENQLHSTKKKITSNRAKTRGN